MQNISTNARSMFIAGPASTISILCHTGFELSGVLPLCSSGISSSYSPTMFTNPPIGNARMEISLYLPCQVFIAGPMPMENSITPTPHARATR